MAGDLDSFRTLTWFLTSCLNPKVDLALRGMGVGVTTELHVRADKKIKTNKQKD